jgi:hypothetical protein
MWTGQLQDHWRAYGRLRASMWSYKQVYFSIKNGIRKIPSPNPYLPTTTEVIINGWHMTFPKISGRGLSRYYPCIRLKLMRKSIKKLQ